jgi:hypothetical protein
MNCDAAEMTEFVHQLISITPPLNHHRIAGFVALELTTLKLIADCTSEEARLS